MRTHIRLADALLFIGLEMSPLLLESGAKVGFALLVDISVGQDNFEYSSARGQ